VPTTRVERTLAASPEAVWAVLADPHHQPRWWPRVWRMEGVRSERWTQVLATARGKNVRADFRLLESDAPRLLCWEQELDGSPFAPLLASARTRVELTADEGQSTRVAIELRQQLRGWSRLAPWQFRRAARRQLGEALESLATIVESPS
jgi:uncharacterized protein YndB with AHSA1/START domain